MNIFIVRHGLAKQNLKHPDEYISDPIFAGYDNNNCLTKQGIQQAQLTGKRLKNIRFDAAFSSHTQRTLLTAANILSFQKRTVPIQVIPSLVECNEWHSKPIPDNILAHIWPDISLVHPFDLIEDTPSTLWLRAKRAAGNILEYSKALNNILVVSHGAFIGKYLIAALSGMTREEAEKFPFGSENCGITKLEYIDDFVRIRSVNETSHLGDLNQFDPFDC